MDSTSKRANQWLKQYLRIWTADDQTTWAQFLLLAEFVHNSWPHDRTSLTLHKLLFGTKPLFPLSDKEAKTPDVTTHLRQIREAQNKAKEALQISKEKLISVNFKEGEQMWLKGQNLRTHHPVAKLAPRWYGPFPIDKKLSPVTYRLMLPLLMKIHPVFHVDLLMWYRETEAHGPNYEKPPPDIIDGEPEWEVEKIINSWLHGLHKRLQFLVRWKGFPPSEDSWVPELDLSCYDIAHPFEIDDFLCYLFTAYLVWYFQSKVMRHDTGDFMWPKCPMTGWPGPLVWLETPCTILMTSRA